MRFRSGRLIISAFIIYSAAATAQPELLRDDSGTLDLILNAKTAAFAEAGPWFGQADENIGDPANFWWEASVEAGLKGRADFFGGSEVYGAYSFIYAQTVGHDASGLTAGLNNPGAIQTEKAFAGWRSGSLFPQLEKNAIDISGGWQNYTIGSGFLIYNGALNGGSDWDTWYQGEIIGEFVLGNSNLLSYQVALTVNPSAELDLHLLYYHFELDQPAALSTEISASNFADEIDLVADWQIDDRFSLSAVVAVAIPNRAAQEYTGGKTTWVHSMLYASWSL